jgi:hypothetical protein
MAKEQGCLLEVRGAEAPSGRSRQRPIQNVEDIGSFGTTRWQRNRGGLQSLAGRVDIGVEKIGAAARRRKREATAATRSELRRWRLNFERRGTASTGWRRARRRFEGDPDVVSWNGRIFGGHGGVFSG